MLQSKSLNFFVVCPEDVISFFVHGAFTLALSVSDPTRFLLAFTVAARISPHEIALTQKERGMKATWKNTTLAESDATVVVEGNHYFPADSINRQYFSESATHTNCPWKGVASYYSIRVDGEVNSEPSAKAANIKGRVAFWKGVTVA